MAPNMTTIMGAKIVAVLEQVHWAARESKYTENSIHKCYNVTLLGGTVANTCFFWSRSFLSYLIASMTTMALIRENLWGLGHLTLSHLIRVIKKNLGYHALLPIVKPIFTMQCNEKAQIGRQ